ncbi:MAG: hypothetical protein ACLTB5_09035 [Acutalibacteraceae bacterium]
MPLARNDESIVTQFTMTTLEELGLLKMDFLGLRTLTVISDAEKNGAPIVKPGFRSRPMCQDDDPAVYRDVCQRAARNGVFQFESGGMQQRADAA